MPSNKQDQPRRVFMTGTYDVKNFGDLLFPIVARMRMADAGFEIVPVSPTGATAAFADAMKCVAARDMLSVENAAGVVIGGGDIIHAHDMRLIAEYRNAGVAKSAAASLWLGATLAAAVRDIPIAWNAPGVPHPFPGSKGHLVDAALTAADYLSLRDQGSAELLEPPGDVALAIAPDSVADIARLWPLRFLTEAFRTLVARKNGEPNAAYAAFHFRDRTLGTMVSEAVAKRIDGFCRANAIRPILIAIGESLGDGELARAIAANLTVPHMLLDDPRSLAEITAAIACSRLSMGASLHGYLVSAAYGVPGRLVAKPSYRKFAGFLDHAGRSRDLARNWDEAFAQPPRQYRSTLPDEVLSKLDTHWENIIAALRTPERKRKERHAFLRVWQDAGRPEWVLATPDGRLPTM